MKIIGIDANTKSIAYAVIEDNKLIDYGQTDFQGERSPDQIKSAYDIASGLYEEHKPDRIWIERAIFVQNNAAVIKLAYCFGAIIAAANTRIDGVVPTQWQSYIGNKQLNNVQKARITEANPGKSKTWYASKFRLARKDYTRQWVNTAYGVLLTSDDISDAVGIAHYGVNHEAISE